MREILIVGAGPVGLTMAAELARYRVPVRIIDRAPLATQTSKALVVWSRTLELMDRAGCTEAFLDAGLRAHGACLRNGTEILGRASFEDVASPYNFALMIPQRDTERLLTEHLRGFGVTVERPVELAGFSEAEDHVEARLRYPDGREEIVGTPWLIGCDGAHSAVRHGIGCEFPGRAQGDDWILADIRFEGDAAPSGPEVSTYLHRDGPFVIFPMPGGRFRIVAPVGKNDPTHPRPEPTLADVQALADSRTGGGFSVVDPVWISNFRINERKVADYRHGRVFLAGDAAHIHSPAGGQGMNTGMQDAFNLAWKLALATHGTASPDILDSYSPERGAVGEMVLRNATRLTDMATLSHPAAQAMRNMALRFMLGFHAVQSRMVSAMAETDIAYEASPLSVGPRAGDRLPPEHYAGPAPGARHAALFVLFAAGETNGAALVARYPALLEAEVRTPREADRLLVVRPDGYIGLSTSAGDWKGADAYLRRTKG